MIKELDTVVFTEDVPDHTLKQRNIETVVLVHEPTRDEVTGMPPGYVR